MSYRQLEHATDAIIEIKANNLHDAFLTAAKSVVDLTIDPEKVEEKESREFTVEDKNLRYLLFSLLEEMIFLLITEGFAVKRIELQLKEKEQYKINLKAYGEPLEFKKHNFKVEIKAPTFHDMRIEQNGEITMRFLLDLWLCEKILLKQ